MRKPTSLFPWVILCLTLLSACAPANETPVAGNPTSIATDPATPITPILGPRPTLQNTTLETPTSTTTVTPTTPATSAPTTSVSPSSPPSQSADSPQMTDEENQLARQLLDQINSDRANNGLAAFTWSSQLTSSAMKHSQRMANGCGLNHLCSNEASLGDRISAEGVKWNAVGENIAYTYGSSSKWQGIYSVHMSMLNETPPNDGHRKNYLNAGFHHLGIGILIDSSGKIWLTEDFSN